MYRTQVPVPAPGNINAQFCLGVRGLCSTGATKSMYGNSCGGCSQNEEAIVLASIYRLWLYIRIMHCIRTRATSTTVDRRFCQRQPPLQRALRLSLSRNRKKQHHTGHKGPYARCQCHASSRPAIRRVFNIRQSQSTSFGAQPVVIVGTGRARV